MICGSVENLSFIVFAITQEGETCQEAKRPNFSINLSSPYNLSIGETKHDKYRRNLEPLSQPCINTAGKLESARTHKLNGKISTKPVIMLTDASYWGENWRSFPEKVEAVRVSDCCKNSRADGYRRNTAGVNSGTETSIYTL